MRGSSSPILIVLKYSPLTSSSFNKRRRNRGEKTAHLFV
nr:MAG TPA: protein of unknown function (DUF4722) [Caudoviricetes sp.]DAW89693.1 MAG TPA: protein of unknown function (DUF4722) [Caudoviricetes sp.]DAW92499.1 MAG TPA: protein of unknown function (DUF4722) [Caudoviricetes sp.]